MAEKTPAEARSGARAALSRALGIALSAAGVTQAHLAADCGTKPQKVHLWTDPAASETPSIADLWQMPKAVAWALLRWAAEPHGLLVVDQLEAATPLDHMGHLHRCLKEGAEATVAYSAALSDGVIDAVEREQVIKELDDDIAAKTSLRNALVAGRPGPRAIRVGAA